MIHVPLELFLSKENSTTPSAAPVRDRLINAEPLPASSALSAAEFPQDFPASQANFQSAWTTASRRAPARAHGTGSSRPDRLNSHEIARNSGACSGAPITSSIGFSQSIGDGPCSAELRAIRRGSCGANELRLHCRSSATSITAAMAGDSRVPRRPSELRCSQRPTTINHHREHCRRNRAGRSA